MGSQVGTQPSVWNVAESGRTLAELFAHTVALRLAKQMHAHRALVLLGLRLLLAQLVGLRLRLGELLVGIRLRLGATCAPIDQVEEQDECEQRKAGEDEEVEVIVDDLEDGEWWG